MFSTADLDALLAALRAAGLRIGAAESLRVHYLVSRLGESRDSAVLREVLLALLVKSVEARQPFERTFDTWADEMTARRPAVEAPGEALPLGSGPEPARRPLDLRFEQRPRRPALRQWLQRHGRALGLALLAVVALGVGTYEAVRWARHPATPEPIAPASTRPPLPLLFFHGIGFAVSGLLLGAGLWLSLHRRRYLPEAAPLPTRPGARSVVPTLPVPPSGWPSRLLDARAQEALVWGISRFVSEEPTRRLNVPSSVAATIAAGGWPALHFHRARHYREVWLWIDESAIAADCEYGPSLRRLANELFDTLRRAGLPVERALYWGIPDRLTRLLASDEATDEFASTEVDERRDSSLVALLTDGRLLADSLASESDRNAAEAILRQLSHWPALAFFDASIGAFSLASLLSRFDLMVLSPEYVVRFLTGAPPGSTPATASSEVLSGDLLLWTAACALAPFPLDEETVFWVHEQLQLTVPVSAISALYRDATVIGSRLTWSHAKRARLLHWLVSAEASLYGDPSSLPQRIGPTLLGRTLALWRARLEGEAERRGAADGTAPWYGTPAEQHLCMQRALLCLWDQPAAAARTLYSLHQGSLGDEISARLADFVPQEGADTPDQILLPWRLAGLPLLSQQLLLSMGLGGKRMAFSAAPLRRPGRLLLAWAGCLALVAAGLAAMGLSLYQRPPRGSLPFYEVSKPDDGQTL